MPTTFILRLGGSVCRTDEPILYRMTDFKTRDNMDGGDMDGWDSRTRLLLGDEGTDRLAAARVLVVGVGGVGGYSAEMLARSGVGHITLVDADTVSVSNLNRQIIATIPDIGQPKVELFARRFHNINPSLSVKPICGFVTPEGVPDLIDGGFDYVVDAIDTVAPKVALISECMRRHVRIISSMGAGGRRDPSKVGYSDIWETREDGLARAVRQRLKKAGLRRPLRVVASTEVPESASVIRLDERNKRSSYGTLATIPAVFGIMLANKVIIDLAVKCDK